MSENRIGIGLAVIALNEKSQFLMARRKNAHGAGSWGLPGGGLEFGESFEQGAAREVLEETGLELSDIEIVTVANHIFKNDNKHFVAVYCIGRVTGEPRLMEPDKHEEWRFFDDWHDLPEPQFVAYHNEVKKDAIEAYKRKAR